MAPGDVCRVRGRSIPFAESIAASGARRTARRRLSVIVTDERGRPALAGGLARWLTRVAPARARGAVGIALVSDARVRALNCEYLGHNHPTDVLSFPASDSTGSLPPLAYQTGPRRRGSPTSLRQGYGGPPKLQRRRKHRGRGGGKPRASRLGSRSRHTSSSAAAAGAYLGDIVIARGVARRQADTVGHDEPTELRVLALHGLLHLLGYDHERDRGTMARVERRLRRKGGLAEGLLER